MGIIINWIIYAVAIGASAYLLPGIGVDSVTTALLVAVVLGLINAVLRPILLILTLPVNILTFGLFTLVINAASSRTQPLRRLAQVTALCLDPP